MGSDGSEEPWGSTRTSGSSSRAMASWSASPQPQLAMRPLPPRHHPYMISTAGSMGVDDLGGGNADDIVPSCGKDNVQRRQWTAEEDNKLPFYITQLDTRNWRLIPKISDLERCRKSYCLRRTSSAATSPTLRSRLS